MKESRMATKKSWNSLLVDTIKEANKPLARKHLLFLIREHYDSNITNENLGINIYYARKAGILARIKCPPERVWFYCNPDWLDENGNLKSSYKPQSIWDKSKTNGKECQV